MKNQAKIDSPSYMEFGLHLEGQESVLLRVPTFWDTVNNQFIGAIKLPISNTIIHSFGKDSFDLQNNFSKEVAKAFSDLTIADELFKMFKPKWHWDLIESSKELET